MTDLNPLETRARQLLGTVKDPETGRNLAKQIHSVSADNNQLKIQGGLTTFAAPLKADFENEITTLLNENLASEVEAISVEITKHIRPAQPLGQVGLTAKAVIAITVANQTNRRRRGIEVVIVIKCNPFRNRDCHSKTLYVADSGAMAILVSHPGAQLSH